MLRAERRRQKAKKKKRALVLYEYPGSIALADNLACCNCRSCGNQRQYVGPPMRELRQPNVEDFEINLQGEN